MFVLVWPEATSGIALWKGWMMGEAKRRREAAAKDSWRAAMDDLVRKLVDDGQLIRAGFISMRAMAIPRDAPQGQIDEMETAFMAGAQHLFGSIMSFLDDDDEPTDADMRRMDLVNKELRTWIERYKLKQFNVEGSA